MNTVPLGKVQFFGDGNQVLFRRITVSANRHFMLGFIRNLGQIVSGRQAIHTPFFVVEKGKIFPMVILVFIKNIETHPTKSFIQVIHIAADYGNYLKQVHIVEIGDAVRRFQNRRKRKHMQKTLSVLPVKTFRTEISAANLRGKQFTFIYVDSAAFGSEIHFQLFPPRFG